MDIRKRKLKGYFILSVLIIMCLFMASAVSFFTPNKNANAFQGADDIALQSTDLDEMLLENYDVNSKGNVFDGEVFWDLVSRISGGTITSKSQMETWAPAMKTSADFREYNNTLGNGAEDIVVTIGGKQWIATCLTNTTNGPVLTFWLADSSITSTWAYYVSSSDGNSNTTWQNQYTSNLYGTSYMRAVTLNNGGWMAKINTSTSPSKSYEDVGQSENSEWAIYTMDTVNETLDGKTLNKSIKEFIEVPNSVDWQKEQQALKYVTSSAYTGKYGYNNNNDALNYGSQNTVGDTKGQGKTLDYKNRLGTNDSYYAAWGADTLWLPSVAETGVSGEEGIWEASDNTRAIGATTWLRSAYHDNYVSMCVLTVNGTGSTSGNMVRVVRPAFHLNLKSASARAGSLGAECPSDVESVYNGDFQTIANIADEDKTWFDSTKVELDYPSGTADGKIILKDAGTYTVTAKIKDALKNDGFTFVGGETELTFNFTIKKKQIECVVEPAQVGGGYIVKPKNGDANKIYDTDTEANGRAPTFTIKYTNTQTSATSTDYPTAVGTYEVTATMDENNNYELKGTCKATPDLTITAKVVTAPTIGTNSLPYNGELQEFTISGLSADVNIDNVKDVDDKVLELKDGVLELKDGKLKVKNAGTYYVTFSLVDKGAMVWSSGGTDNISRQVKITPKALGVNISCDANNNTWNYGVQPTVTITEDSCTNDTVELKVYYIDNSKGTGTKYDEINSIKSVSGKTTTITMPGGIAKGDYTIYVEKANASSSNSNGNYTLATPKTLVFHVSGKSVTLQDTDIDWLCNSISIGYPTANYSVTYKGSSYTFSIDDSVLASRGVKIDTTKSGTTNGYSGNISATNASGTSPYSVTVHLTNLDNTYETYTKQYTLNYRIDKAKYKLSGLNWPSVNKLEYNGSGQSMELEGVLPAGLEATYTGDISKTPVGNYTTTVTFTITSAYADNYVLPVATDKTSYIGDNFKFSFDWEIIQATISVSWKNENNGNVTKYTWPTLNNMPQANMVDYTYYDKDNKQFTDELPKPEDVTEETTYKVVATLKGTYTKNYKLSTGDTAEYTFVIGKDKLVVKLELQWNNDNIQGKQLPYAGSAYTPTIEILQADGSVGSQDITLKYYKDGAASPITGEPTAVGTYRIEVVLSDAKAEDNYIDHDCAEFTFEIIKADFDVSGLKWQYTHGSVTATYDFDQSKWLDAGNNEIDSITYDKTAHTLTLVGKDNVSDDLTISVVGDEETNAGSHTAQITFSYDNKNYNAPNFPTSLSWSIAKAKVDASAIVWGYVIGDGEETEYTGALPYARANGKEAAYTVGLINVPEILKDYISYTGGERTQSKKGDYSIQYVLADLGSNYESVVMPSSLQTKLNWSISVKILPTPVFDKSWTEFDGEVHDFAQMFGITEDGWENYMTITITKDGNAYDGLDGEAYKAIKAGEYTVVFDLVDYDNIDWQDGVWPAASTLVSVKAYEINLEWQGNNTNATAVLQDWVKSYVDYRYKDGEGNILANGIRDMETGVPYYKELFAKDSYENDIKIYGEPKTVLRPGSSASVVKPVFDANKKVTYNNGNPHTIEEFLRNGDKMPTGVKFDILDGNLTDAGDYTVKISLEDEEIFSWEDGSSDSYTVTLKVEKATITQNKLNWTTGEDGLPKLTVRGNSEIEFSYTYYDEEGYELTLAEIADGMEYAKVVARLDNGNYAMVDATNTVVEEVTYSPNGDDNKKPNSGDQSGENPPSGNEGGGLFGGSLEEIMAKLKEVPLWQLIAIVISIILIIVFLSKTAKYDGERKKFNKKASKLESMYAGAFLGVAMSIWTAIACVLIVMAVVSFIMMLIAKSRRNRAEEEYEDHLDEYNRNKADLDEKKRDENMRMMLMGMMGGNAGGGAGQQGFGYAQPMVGIGADEIRGIFADTMSNLLPNMQQYLPQEVSYNDELVQQFIEQNAQNEELMRQMNEENEERIRQLTAQNEQIMEKLVEKITEQPKENVDEEVIERLVEKLAKQKELEKEAEKEVASAVVNEKTIEELKETIRQEVQSLINATSIKTVEKDSKDEKIEMLMRNQEMLMRQMMEMSSRNNDKQIVMPYMSQPSERLMEKMIDLAAKSAEKSSVEKYVPVPVEKVVEKEVPVEKPVPMPVEKPAPKAKEVAPRLTLDEAYAKMSASQKKIFDTLKNYALSKDKCKEKKSTYFTVLGQSTVNPLVKLTIKKNTTVALFKMEDEYFKDIRRNAGSDGTKVKVKESEIVVSDNQALATAKDMIDLREDQIERYNDYLKEQKSMRKK